jgi:hypothetical protein
MTDAILQLFGATRSEDSELEYEYTSLIYSWITSAFTGNILKNTLK